MWIVRKDLKKKKKSHRGRERGMSKDSLKNGEPVLERNKRRVVKSERGRKGRGGVRKGARRRRRRANKRLSGRSE